MNEMQRTNLEEITGEILELKQQAAENIIEIGRKLTIVKEMLNHGEFTKWLEDTVDYTPQTARKFMKIADEFGQTDLPKGKSPFLLSSEKLYALSTLKENDRQQFMHDNDVESMSTREVKKSISDFKKAKKKPAKKITLIKNKKDIAISDITHAPEEIYKIWEDTVKLKNEIKLKTGEFYTDIDSDLELTELESLLITRYLAGEITHNQLGQVIQVEKMNIPFICDEAKFEKFIESLNLSNSYSHLRENDGIFTDYYGIYEDELSFDMVWNYSWEKNEDERQGYIEQDEYRFSMDNIKVARGWIDSYKYICIYKGDELFAYYRCEYSKEHYYRDNVIELFKVCKIDKKYLNLVDQFIAQQDKEHREEEVKSFNETKRTAKFIFEKDDECYMLVSHYSNTDSIKVYKDKELVCTYNFKDAILGNKNFASEVANGDWMDSINKNLDHDIKLKHIKEFSKALKTKANKIKKEHEQRERQERKRKQEQWDNFNWEDMFGTKKQNTGSIDIFTGEEQELLKEILENPTIAKKLYTMAAREYHPDKFATKGEKAVKKAEEKMKLLNAINEKITA